MIAKTARLTGRLLDEIVALALLAAVLGLLIPSRWVSQRSDWLLAVLVLFAALGIEPRRLAGLRNRLVTLAALSLGPLLALAAAAWAIGRGFAGSTREGLLALGLSSSEVATVGLVALAGGDAVLALGVVAGSLVAAAILGPLLIGALAGTAAHVSAGSLLGRFALVVLVPLLAGLVVRGSRPAVARLERGLNRLSVLAVCLLVYAAISGLGHVHDLPLAVLAAVLFLLVGGLLAIALVGLPAARDAAAVGLPAGLRDFAVAAALATQAFGIRAGTVPGVYGVLMLFAGAVAANRLRRRRP